MTMINVGLVLLVAWPLYTLALITASTRAALRDSRSAIADAATDQAPSTFWIIVPCLNEERVVARTVTAALGLPVPRDTQLYVLAVDDGSDDSTPDVLAAIDHPNLHILRRDLPNARKGKGEALNAAFEYIKADAAAAGTAPHDVVIGVIDGDGRGSPNLICTIASVMQDPQVGAVQCRVRIHNRQHILAAVQDLEFACIANASQLLRNSLGTVGLGGNGQFARLSALINPDGPPWSKCLVEDLELGLRMHLAGIKIRYISNAYVSQQGLTSVNRLLRQRTRWAQGNLQCVAYVPKLIASRKIGNTALIEMLYYLLAPWVNAVGSIAMVALWGVAVYDLSSGSAHPILVADWFQLGQVLSVWGLGMIAPHLVWAMLHRVQVRDEGLVRLLLAGLAYPGFLLMGLVSTCRALGRQIARRNTWAKTERLAEDGEPVVAVLPKPRVAPVRSVTVMSTQASPVPTIPVQVSPAQVSPAQVSPALVRPASPVPAGAAMAAQTTVVLPRLTDETVVLPKLTDETVVLPRITDETVVLPRIPAQYQRGRLLRPAIPRPAPSPA